MLELLAVLVRLGMIILAVLGITLLLRLVA
jgi:hypothetical protein